MAVNELMRRVLTCPHPNARGAYIAPLYRQAKSIMWDYLQQFSRVIPGVVFNQSELKASYPNGATITLYGAENPDSLRGNYWDYVVMDEVAQMAPRTWREVVRPSLSERLGGCLMIGTPFGWRNQFAEFWRDAEGRPDWYRSMLKVTETDALLPAEVEALRMELSPEEFQQELMCSFDSAIKGAYYSMLISAANDAGRITTVPYTPGLLVHTSWDLGMRDRTVVWYWQTLSSGEIRAIDLDSWSGTGLPAIVKVLDAKPYVYGKHLAPPDIAVRELGTGKSRLEVAEGLGLRFTVVKQLPVADGIEAVRSVLPLIWFDREKTGDGVEALRNYRTEWDDLRRVLKPTPLHDWSSDFCDAVRYFAIGMAELRSGQWHKIDYGHTERATI